MTLTRALGLAAAVLALAAPGRAEIYRWTDAQGRIHFTERIDQVPPEFDAVEFNPAEAAAPQEGTPEEGGAEGTSHGGDALPHCALTRQGSSGRFSLTNFVMLMDRDVTVLDMEASIEHLTRGTVRNVDVLLVVTEPYYRSLETMGRMVPLAQELGVPLILGVADKVRSEQDAAASMQRSAEQAKAKRGRPAPQTAPEVVASSLSQH